MSERTYTIGEVAKEVGRAVHTVRVWEYQNKLPEHLRPQRNARGWRVWNREQIEGIKNWIVEADLTPGKAFRRRKDER